MPFIVKQLKVFEGLLLIVDAIHILDEVTIYLREHILDVLLPSWNDINDVKLHKHQKGEGKRDSDMFAHNCFLLPVLPNQICWWKRFVKVHWASKNRGSSRMVVGTRNFGWFLLLECDECNVGCCQCVIVLSNLFVYFTLYFSNILKLLNADCIAPLLKKFDHVAIVSTKNELSNANFFVVSNTEVIASRQGWLGSIWFDLAQFKVSVLCYFFCKLVLNLIDQMSLQT